MVSADSKITSIKQIHSAIDNGDYKEADFLVNQFCISQGLDTEYPMPVSFISELKEKEQKSMKIKKPLVKAAAVVLILSLSGGSAYAAVSYFKNTEHFKYGQETCGNSARNETEASDQFSDVKLPDKETDVKILSTETGDKTTAWLSKETRQETNYGYESDDGVNWKESTPDVQIITSYKYDDYNTVRREHDLPELFSKAYESDGNITLEEYRHETEDEIFSKDLQAGYKYKNGSFTVDMTRDCEWNGEDTESIVITSTEPVKNQREYTASSGYCFKLSDDTEFGTLRTTTLISYKEYLIILSFFDLTDEEIYEILDSVIVE